MKFIIRQTINGGKTWTTLGDSFKCTLKQAQTRFTAAGYSGHTHRLFNVYNGGMDHVTPVSAFENKESRALRAEVASIDGTMTARQAVTKYGDGWTFLVAHGDRIRHAEVSDYLTMRAPASHATIRKNADGQHA